jgi:hypothetical protein
MIMSCPDGNGAFPKLQHPSLKECRELESILVQAARYDALSEIFVWKAATKI